MPTQTPGSTQRPISKMSPKQPQAASPRKEREKGHSQADLANIDRVCDLDGQKAQASEHYGASVGRKPSQKRP